MKKSGHRQSNHVVPQQGSSSNPIIPPREADDSDKQKLSSSHPDQDTVTIEFVVPDDVTLDQGFVEDQNRILGSGCVPYPDRCARRFTEDQDLEAVAAVVSDVYNAESKERVALYLTSERSEALSNDITVGELPKSTLYWEMITVEVEI